MKRLTLDGTRRALEPALRRVLHFYWRFARAMTLGVRTLVIDGEGRIFLVKHSYVSGWHLPGGGVEAGEFQHRGSHKDAFAPCAKSVRCRDDGRRPDRKRKRTAHLAAHHP